MYTDSFVENMSARIHFTFCPLEDAVGSLFNTQLLGTASNFVFTINLKSNKNYQEQLFNISQKKEYSLHLK